MAYWQHFFAMPWYIHLSTQTACRQIKKQIIASSELYDYIMSMKLEWKRVESLYVLYITYVIVAKLKNFLKKIQPISIENSLKRYK